MHSGLTDIKPEKMQELLDSSNSKADVLRKIGYSPYGGDHPTLDRYIREYNLDLTKLEENRKKTKAEMLKGQVAKKISLSDIFSGKIPYRDSDRLKKRILKEGLKEHKCEKCGRTEWLGQPIPLQLDHINGDHSDNSWENIRLLCPNCHFQTSTHNGKNPRRQVRKTPKP